MTSFDHQKTQAQEEFEHLRFEIDSLQSNLKKTIEFLDRALKFYQEKVAPVKKTFVNSLMDCSKLMYQHYKNPCSLSDQEKEDLKQLSLRIIASIIAENPDPELLAILNELRKMDPIPPPVHEEIKQKINEPRREDRSEKARDEPNNNQELEKPKKKQDLTNPQKKALVKIYRQLAKKFHPDLEQDPDLKEEKEAMMKDLIKAYENNDLNLLLSLQKQWVEDLEKIEESESSDEQLEIYNSVLKDQINALQNNINFAFRNPKYWVILQYGSNEPGSLMLKMEDALQAAQTNAEGCQSIVKSLKTDQAEQILRDIISREVNR